MLIAALTVAAIAGVLTAGAAWAGQAGCDGSGGSLAMHDRSINSGGFDRTYQLQVPPKHDGSTALPVVLNFHGMGSSANDEGKDADVAARAWGDGFVLIVPQGIGNVPAWNSGGVFSAITPANDVKFVRDMLDVIGTEFCIDPARVFSIGNSNGGGMSDRLGCEMPERIVAIAPVSGAYTQRPKRCSKKRPISVIEFHGDADKTTPYRRGGKFTAFMDIPTWVRDWADREKCRGKAKKSKLAHNLTRTTYSKCSKKVKVEHYRVHGGTHSWFDTPVAGTNVKTTARIWRFIKSRPKNRYASFAVKVSQPGKYVFKAYASTDGKGNNVKDRFVQSFKKSGTQIVSWSVPKKLRRSKLRAYRLTYKGPGDSGEVHLRVTR